MTELRSRLPLLALFLASTTLAAIAQRTPIQIHADLTDAPRKLFHADITLPVHRGPLDLITPEWIPGAHGPDGPIHDITGVRFEADGHTLPWRRDPVDTYEYHLDIPAGVTTLHAHLDCIRSRNTRTEAVLEWEDLMLYPAHLPVHDIAIQPTVTVPANWAIGTSLKPTSAYDPQHPAATVEYAPTTVELLEDSPILTGLYFHEYPLAPGTQPAHFMDVAGPTAASIVATPETLAQMSHLVTEAIATYGPPHYTSYHFLVLLQGTRGGGGLEHHESSDNTLQTDFFTGYKPSVGMAGLLPHEFTHSWNGKYRRPDGLSTPDYATPMQDNLLWVYEGLTNYLGDVMGTRVGTVAQEQYRQDLALTAAEMDSTSGRAWRSIEDTTFDSAMPRNGGSRGGSWNSWKRGTDYYPEGTIFWLNVDTTIRKLTNDKKTLRDFLQLFLQKGGAGVPRVEPYSLSELTADLNQIVPNDWAAFIHTRLYDVQPHVNTEGIEQSGYHLDYTPDPTPEMKHELAGDPSLATWFSIGLELGKDGTISDVRVGSAADKAGFAPGQKFTAINGRVFTTELLVDALKSPTPINLLVQDDDTLTPVTFTYTEGLRYPRLSRIPNTPDYLTEILTPSTPTPKP